MIRQDVIAQLYECQVVDPCGEELGPVERVWVDERTGDPAWASVRTGTRESVVPLQRAELRENQLRVPVHKGSVKGSPKVEATEDHMTDEDLAALYRHYGFGPQYTDPGQPPVRRPGSCQ